MVFVERNKEHLSEMKEDELLKFLQRGIGCVWSHSSTAELLFLLPY